MVNPKEIFRKAHEKIIGYLKAKDVYDTSSHKPKELHSVAYSESNYDVDIEFHIHFSSKVDTTGSTVSG